MDVAGLIEATGFSQSHISRQLGQLQREVVAFYWTVLAPDIVNPGREEQGSVSV
jgi:hypothetical protein